MTIVPMETRKTEIDQAQVQRGLDLLTASLRSPQDTQMNKAAVASFVSQLSQPADMVWTLGRVAALLNPYFDKATPQGIREIEAEDWAEAVKTFPDWAIERACRWWKSVDNPDRRKRPLEGDIVLRIRRETEAVRVTKAKLDRGWDSGPNSQGAASPDDSNSRPDTATRTDILAASGFKPKGFPKVGEGKE